MSDTESRLLALELQYDRIEKKLDKILEVFDTKISKSCNKMSSHIDFVENVYDNVKNPLGYLCNKVSGFMGSNDNYSLDNQKLEALEEGREEDENFGLEE
jgi:cell shape-determining protein MreC|tara:strand:+ start:193 stop:492 length:300 start_codon:yes stop_codon:yes gene_type:complete